MMDEETVEQKMERAWDEGARAPRQIQTFNGTATRTVNPYTPVVEYTPSLVEMNAVLLSKFTQEEIWRGEKRRDDQLAALERVRVVGELKVMKLRERRIYEEELQAMKVRRSHIISLPERGFLDSRARDGAVGDCIAVIKRMTG
jgi:hypothetical protein